MPPPLTEPRPPDPLRRRYSTRAFPAYRFVPTLNPHPCADPRGHSYQPPGTPPRRVQLRPPEEWDRCEEYLTGVDLYNFAYWWEAHETWEAIWQSSDKSSPQGRLLQALIQVSAAHLKRYLGQQDGVARLLERAEAHFDFVEPRAPTRYMGLDIAAFRRAVRSCFHAGGPFPFIDLAP